MSKVKNNSRICMLDELRGIAIILMVIYHTLYSMAFIFKLKFSYIPLYYAAKLQPIIPLLFISLCGIVCSFSHNNLKRGIKLFTIAMVITIVTTVLVPSSAIICGILHFLGISLIIYSLAGKLIDKIPTYLGIAISLILYAALYNIPYGYIGFKPLLYLNLPSQLYSCYPLFIIGLPTADFSSSDYFPLIPNIFLLLFGIFVGKLMKEKGVPQFMYKRLCPPLDFLGKHSLVIYIIHQPVIISVLFIITRLFS